MSVIARALRTTPAVAAAALLAAGAAAAAKPLPVATMARLHWTEYAPLCNTVATIGVTTCGPDRFAPVFRLGVNTLRVSADRWRLGVALTNLTAAPLSFSGRFELCVLAEVTTTRTDCRAASASSPRPRTLAAGATWEGTEHGEADIAAGYWIRVLLPGVTGTFSSPTGGVIAWLTVHAYHLVPGGGSVARYNGST
jgi:hypothetical protein